MTGQAGAIIPYVGDEIKQAIAGIRRMLFGEAQSAIHEKLDNLSSAVDGMGGSYSYEQVLDIFTGMLALCKNFRFDRSMTRKFEYIKAKLHEMEAESDTAAAKKRAMMRHVEKNQTKTGLMGMRANYTK